MEDTVYEIELQDESGNMIELVKVKGDRSVNALRRFVQRLGFEAVQVD